MMEKKKDIKEQRSRYSFLQKKNVHFCFCLFSFGRCAVSYCIDDNWMVRIEAEMNMTEVP
jgi:hypothetical protein